MLLGPSEFVKKLEVLKSKQKYLLKIFVKILHTYTLLKRYLLSLLPNLKDWFKYFPQKLKDKWHLKS